MRQIGCKEVSFCFTVREGGNFVEFMTRFLTWASIICALILVGVSIWKTQFDADSKLKAFERAPEGIMGTSCRLVVVMDYREHEAAKKLLDKAEYRIRYIESLASNWIEESEVETFNRLNGGEVFELSKTNADVIRAGYEGFLETGGAFDITCRPLISLWKSAGKSGKLPSTQEIEEARVQSSWEFIEILPEKRIIKHSSTARVDLGGIAKGYAIDQAIEGMMELGAAGALVEIGGDLRVEGTPVRRDQGRWKIEVASPFRNDGMMTLNLDGGYAVCTSGNYARFVEIEGNRYSHILDPRSGYPTENVPSVTVISKSAMRSDIWATALSVLGESGMGEALPADLEVMLVVGESVDVDILKTDEFSLFE